jgi:hypothetical protein
VREFGVRGLSAADFERAYSWLSGVLFATEYERKT